MIIRKPVIIAVIVAVGLIAFLSSASLAAATYKATLLHPLGLPAYNSSVAQAAAGKYQGGYASHSSSGPGGYSHALIWNGSGESFVNLHPTGYLGSGLFDMTLTRQVGAADGHAMMWNGSAESYVDLHPAGFTSSSAYGVFGDVQVGAGTVGGRTHALVWNGTAASVVDLQPTGYEGSYGAAVYENSQVGSATYHLAGHASEQHAALWHGTAESFVDLHPMGYGWSHAAAVWGNQQAGWGAVGFDAHALLWNGTAESVVDLNPVGFTSSYVYDVLNGKQVGGANGPAMSGIGHALLWNSSADDYIDLHSFLADLPVTIARSFATAISADGRIVGYGFTTNGNAMAVLWTPVPEPTNWILICLGVGSFLSARRTGALLRQGGQL